MQNQAFDLGVIASRHMVDADARAQAVRCACTHGQLMGGTLSGLLRQEAARSKQMVARSGLMGLGRGRMAHSSNEIPLQRVGHHPAHRQVAGA